MNISEETRDRVPSKIWRQAGRFRAPELVLPRGLSLSQVVVALIMGRKKVEAQSLLPRRGGLFGKKASRSDDADDDLLGTKVSLFRTSSPSVRTPPVSPEVSDEDASPRKVEDDDEQSNLSDLTEQPIMDPPGRMLHSRSSDSKHSEESPVVWMKTRLSSRGDAPPADPEPSSAVVTPSLVQNLLSIVDKACVTPSSASSEVTPLQSMLSFSPEWGRAPTEEEDEPVQSRWSAPAPSPSPSKHENFEMILQEKQQVSTKARVKKQVPPKKKKTKLWPKLNKLFPPKQQQDASQPPVASITTKTKTPRVEEEKKEDDGEHRLGVQPAPPSSRPRPLPPSMRASGGTRRHRAKEARYKHLLGTWMNAKLPLETVNEDSELESSEATELKVRVPGLKNPDAFLSGKDLIGTEYIEEDAEETDDSNSDNVKEETKEVDKTATKEAQPACTHSQEVENISDEGQYSPMRKSRTWIEKLRFTGSCEDPSVSESAAAAVEPKKEDGIPLARMVSAPGKLSKESASVKKEEPQPKAIWKSATCPKTGRTYYYHRITRETTWTKPPDEQLAQSKPKAAAEEPAKRTKAESEGEVLRKRSHRDFDRNVWKTKEEIAKILETMSPPDGQSVERLMAQYEGREEELLQSLRDVAESQPFDEPVVKQAQEDGEAAPAKNELEAQTVARSTTAQSIKTARTRTHVSMASGFSSGLMSASTQPIKNTAFGRFGRKRDPIPETESQATSISSKHGYDLPPAQQVFDGKTSSRVPSKLTVPRIRELNVEEFGSERYKAPSLEMKGVVRSALREIPVAARDTPTLTVVAKAPDASPYFGDNESTENRDTDSGPNDSISALSEADLSFVNRQEAFEQARRQALDEAIAREDWDLAAALSEGMRSIKSSPHRSEKREWKQTELDRFISSNDWDAVANYIAKVRENVKNQKNMSPRQQRKHHPQKRFGATSQLQKRRSGGSVDSWETGSYSSVGSEYSSASSYTDEEPFRARNGRKNFAC